MTLNRNFYSFAIFIWALLAVVTFIQGVIFFLIGQRVIALTTFFPWYIFSSVLSLLCSFVILAYFSAKKHRLPFWMMILYVATGLVQFSIVVGTFSGLQELMNYYSLSDIVVSGTGVAFGFSLIISEARKKYWLKLAGISYVVLGIIIMTVHVKFINSTMNEKIWLLDQIVKWPLLIGWVSPALVMINFLKTAQLDPEDRTPSSTSSTNSENLIAATRLIILLATVFFSLKIMGETASRLLWEKRLVTQEREWNKVAGSRIFTNSNGDTLMYQLFGPPDFDPNKKYPMVVCLPYSGGVEGAPPAKLLMNEINRKKYPSFLFVPFCPNGSGWGGIPNYPTMDSLVFDSIEALQSENSAIDADRVYVTGVSRGGYGSWNFISLRPDMFAAAMPVCGAGDPALAPNVVNVAVWAFHGENDFGVPVSGSRDMIAAIKKSGGNPKYTEFEGAGHDIWHYVTITPGVLDWLFDQKRNSDHPVGD